VKDGPRICVFLYRHSGLSGVLRCRQVPLACLAGLPSMFKASAIIAMGLTCSTAAWATENGTQHFPIGVNTISAGNLPPPGMLQYLDYLQVAPSPESHGADGKNTGANFDLTAEANASRFLYTWKGVSIAGLNYTTGLVVPIVNLNLNVNGAHGHNTSIGDIDVQNYLGGHNQSHTLFYFFGLDTYIPTGSYNVNRMINVGSNYYTFSPNANVTWMPTKRWELTGSIFPEFNTVNHADHYHSGSDIDVDYGVTYRPFAHNQKLGVGLNGFFYKQLGDDTIDGAKVDGTGYKGRVFAIGPQARYDWAFGGVVLKYQHEFAVVNRPAGEQVWLQFALPLFGKPKEG
jgi:hypothetical protein